MFDLQQKNQDPKHWCEDMISMIFECAGWTAEAVQLCVDAEGARPGGGEERSHRRREFPSETKRQVNLLTHKFSVADPGCFSRILIFIHLGSRIQKQQQNRGVKKICCHTFFFEP